MLYRYAAEDIYLFGEIDFLNQTIPQPKGIWSLLWWWALDCTMTGNSFSTFLHSQLCTHVRYYYFSVPRVLYPFLFSISRLDHPIILLIMCERLKRIDSSSSSCVDSLYTKAIATLMRIITIIWSLLSISLVHCFFLESARFMWQISLYVLLLFTIH